MPTLDWNESFTMGIPAIDVQHKRLLELINHLHEAIMEEDDSSRLSEIKAQTIHALSEYCKEHFEDEERYMQSIHFPGFAEHQAEHRKFLAKVTGYNEVLMNGTSVHASRVLKTMADWVHDHMLAMDRQYSNFATSAGVSERIRS